MTDDIALTEDQTTYRARQARYWRQQEHLLRAELLHDLADRCAERAANYERAAAGLVVAVVVAELVIRGRAGR